MITFTYTRRSGSRFLLKLATGHETKKIKKLGDYIFLFCQHFSSHTNVFNQKYESSSIVIQVLTTHIMVIILNLSLNDYHKFHYMKKLFLAR